MEKFRVIEWKNDWKLLHGRDTVTRFPSRTLQKSDRVTSIAKFHRPRFFRFSTPRLELKEFLPSTPYLWNAVSLHSISSLTIFSRWRGETLLKILRDFFRTREKVISCINNLDYFWIWTLFPADLNRVEIINKTYSAERMYHVFNDGTKQIKFRFELEQILQ